MRVQTHLQMKLTRVQINSQIDVYRLLKANGEDDSTPEQQAQLMNRELKTTSKLGLTLIKAFSQFVGPTGLNARYEIHDPKEQWYCMGNAITI
jgi:hypothetical protein